jgi:hypothetical protein
MLTPLQSPIRIALLAKLDVPSKSLKTQPVMEALWAPVLRLMAAEVVEPILARAKVNELNDTPGTLTLKVCLAPDAGDVVSLYRITSAADPERLLNPIVVEPPAPMIPDKS